MRRLLASFASALAAALAKIYGWAGATLSEAAEPITRHWPAVRHGLGFAPSYAAIGAGAALGAPGAVLRGVGNAIASVIPTPPPTPEAVANAASAADATYAAAKPALSLVDMSVGERAQAYAVALQARDKKGAALALSSLDTSTKAWVSSLGNTAMHLLRILPADRIDEHLSTHADARRSPLLPMLEYVPDTKATATTQAAYRQLADDCLAGCEAPAPGFAYGR